jgi:FAD-dependent urate hydroxylase
VLNAGGYATGLDLGDPGTMHMIFGARTFFSYLSDGHGGVWWFANPPRRREPARGELAAVPAEEWRSTVLDLVAGDKSPARQIIEATPDLFEPWPTHDLRRVPTWHRDGMLVIGDAAHAASPSSGQGASMAIEDAAVLAVCLRDASDTRTALIRYEGLRRPRVTRVVREGRRNGTGKTPGPFGRTIRDAVIRRMFRRPPRRQDAHSWLYDYRVDWDSGVSPSVAGPPVVE